MEEKERERRQDGVHSTRKPTSASACFCAQFKVYSSMTAEAEKAEGGGQVGGGRIRRAGGRREEGRREDQGRAGGGDGFANKHKFALRLSTPAKGSALTFNTDVQRTSFGTHCRDSED